MKDVAAADVVSLQTTNYCYLTMNCYLKRCCFVFDDVGVVADAVVVAILKTLLKTH